MQKIIEIIRAIVKYSQNMMTDRLTDRKKKYHKPSNSTHPIFSIELKTSPSERL